MKIHFSIFTLLITNFVAIVVTDEATTSLLDNESIELAFLKAQHEHLKERETLENNLELNPFKLKLKSIQSKRYNLTNSKFLDEIQ
jgi:hypothetical protein